MSFMDETISGAMGVWQECAGAEFLRGMAAGTLDRARFFDYMVQDSIYLRGYLKAFAYAMTKSDTLADMQLYYSLLGYVNDGENATRLEYLRECGLTDADVDRTPMRPQCAAYVDFLLKIGREGAQEDILMATMPCMLGYGYVFGELKRRAPHVMDGYYAPLVADYTSEGYRECCAFWQDICNRKCEGLSDARKAGLRDIFMQASRHELYFWQMAGEERV